MDDFSKAIMVQRLSDLTIIPVDILSNYMSAAYSEDDVDWKLVDMIQDHALLHPRGRVGSAIYTLGNGGYLDSVQLRDLQYITSNG